MKASAHIRMAVYRLFSLPSTTPLHALLIHISASECAFIIDLSIPATVEGNEEDTTTITKQTHTKKEQNHATTTTKKKYIVTQIGPFFCLRISIIPLP